MAKEYLDKLSAFMAEAAAGLPGNVHLECKHFFSGAALYAKDRICITLTPAGLAIKLPEGTRDNLLKDKKAVPLRYFPEGPIKKGYALFPSGMAEGNETPLAFVNESIKYVLTLPKPKRKQK